MAIALLLVCVALGCDGADLEIRGRSDLNDGVVGWTGVTGRSDAVEGKGIVGTVTADRGIGV